MAGMNPVQLWSENDLRMKQGADAGGSGWGQGVSIFHSPVQFFK